jgi:tetratricopeptide (TPR) repeat protein
MIGGDRETAFVLCLFLLFTTLAVVVLNDWLQRRSDRKATLRGRSARASKTANQTNWGLIVAMIVVVPVLMCVTLFMDWFRNRGPGIIAILVVGVPLLLIVVFVAARIIYMRWKKRHVLRAMQIAQTGNVAGALGILEEQLRSAGPSGEIYNSIAVLHCMQDEWAEGLRVIEESERLGLTAPRMPTNKGVCLLKLGRLDEAARVLETEHRKFPQDLMVTCNYGCLLSEMGDNARAVEMLGRAEDLYRKQWVFGAAEYRRAREKMLDEVRDRVILA